MKDGRTHLAHTAEHAVDLDTGAILGVTVSGRECVGDTTTLVDTLVTAAEQVEAVGGAGDRGGGGRQGISQQRDDGRVCGHRRPQLRLGAGSRPAALDGPGVSARDAVYANRRRIRGARGKRLLRHSGASSWNGRNAHLYETGRMTLASICVGHPNILKRLLRPGLRRQSRVAHAAPDGRGHARGASS